MSLKDSVKKLKGNQIKNVIKEEVSMKMDTTDAYIKFKKQCEISKESFTKKILKHKNEGKKICGYAATAKSSTILNYCKIDKDTVDFIADSTDEKVGKFYAYTYSFNKRISQTKTRCCYSFCMESQKGNTWKRKKFFKRRRHLVITCGRLAGYEFICCYRCI